MRTLPNPKYVLDLQVGKVACSSSVVNSGIGLAIRMSLTAWVFPVRDHRRQQRYPHHGINWSRSSIIILPILRADKRSTAVEQQLIALRMKYVPVFEKVISPKKTALWYQIDHRIDLLINLQLSAQIPMVDTTK